MIAPGLRETDRSLQFTFQVQGITSGHYANGASQND
jgi:hypothetical protein